MKPYGQRMGANDYDYDGKDEPVAVVEKQRARQEGRAECTEALFRPHSSTCPCRWDERLAQSRWDLRSFRNKPVPTCPKCSKSTCVAPGHCDDPEHFFGGIGR